MRLRPLLPVLLFSACAASDESLLDQDVRNGAPSNDTTVGSLTGPPGQCSGSTILSCRKTEGMQVIDYAVALSIKHCGAMTTYRVGQTSPAGAQAGYPLTVEQI